MKKLENVLGKEKDEDGNPLYQHIFKTDELGNYTFPSDMTKLLGDRNLSSDALNVMMYQMNRSIHLIDGAKDRSEETI